MANPSAVQTTQPAPGPSGQPAQALVPFVRGALRHVEALPLDKTTTAGASTLVGQVDVPAHGFLRSINLRVEATGGTGTAAVYEQDAPWSAIQEVTLLDTNGAPIFGPFSGYELYLAHTFGGYVGNPDPTRNPAYVAPTTAGNFSFTLRIPVEISSRDALGCLPNQNAAQPYQLRIVQADKTDVYSTDPTGLPDIRVRAEMEAWSPPSPFDLFGRPVAQQPPAVQTTQFWSRTQRAINAGQFNVQLPRVGNVIRNLILIFRNDTPARVSTAFPDPITISLDSKQIATQRRDTQQQYMAERNLLTTQPTGVMLFDFTSDWDGLIGGEMRDQWLPTTPATRLDISGNWGAAGTLTIITNDVAPAGDVFI